jgi:hypothetical protein
MKNINSELDTVLRRFDHKLLMSEIDMQRDYDLHLYAYIYEKIRFNLGVKISAIIHNTIHWQLVNKIENR